MSNENRTSRYGRYADNVIAIVDFVIFNIAFLFTCAVAGNFTTSSLRMLLLAVNVAFIPSALIFAHFNRRRSLYMEAIVRNSVLATALQFGFFVFLIYILGVNDLSARYFYIFYPTALVLLMLWWVISRSIIKRYRAKGRNSTRVVIIGSGPTAQHLYSEMMSDAGFGYQVDGFFDNVPSPELPAGSWRGELDKVESYLQENEIDEVYYTLSGERHDVLRACIDAADNNLARFYYVPQINRYVNREFSMSSIGSTPVLTLMNQPLESLFNRSVKRTFDFLFSSVALLFSPIIFIPVAIAIKLSSPGPVFFKQLRTGYKGRDFYCWKFRTMKVNADADKAQATRDDPRKTKVGEFLRKTSIDELPQFINVWLGDMSIVGPRPHMLTHTEQYRTIVKKYMMRHFIKPGVTGWAQVNGYRGQTDELWKMEKRVEYDVWYVKNWSFLLDLKIILRTITNAIHGEENAF